MWIPEPAVLLPMNFWGARGGPILGGPITVCLLNCSHKASDGIKNAVMHVGANGTNSRRLHAPSRETPPLPRGEGVKGEFI